MGLLGNAVELLGNVIESLNKLTPLGLAGGLAYVIYQLVGNKKNVKAISDNHLSGLPEMQETQVRIQESIVRMELTLGEIRDGINYLKGRVNGRS